MTSPSTSEIRRPRTRERMLSCPNFRDFGMTVDRHLLSVVASLMRQHGEAWASEAGLRWMIFQDAGHMPGVDTVATAIERLELCGMLEQVWLKPGGILPDGNKCTHGTRLVVVPKLWRDRRTVRTRDRRAGATWKEHLRGRAAFEQQRAALSAKVKVEAPPPIEDIDRRRVDAQRQLAELAAKWASDKPPD